MRRPTLLLPLLALLLAGCASAPDGGRDERPDDGAATGTASGTADAGIWRPAPGTGWQWQLSGRLDTTVDAPVYDIDGFDQSAATVAQLHEDGRKVICYLSTGAWEDWRPDAASFPKSVIGKGNGWEGERWLDIRALDVLEPLMAARLDMCREKGFDAVEPDNMDGYKNTTGFPVKAADQLRYNRLIAELAHDRGMSVGLKNDLDQIPELVGDFDFAVNEQCAQYDECADLTPFIEAGKAVFHVEYELPTSAFCADSRRLRLSSLLKKYELGVWREAC
ncbi:endo alpha-1,4 polygalactosaminidase [Streptomyces maremycinicus]|uniref:endo alpha-1,4 polygalactosaminidase n=1 Tax=Streptomyces maremycinicus TaxID=1679753 RepID=UPI000787AAA0|nr:endo alpha-1,4 polygalactosaminidase [Streptomyces sp. NBRC 110468]